MGEIRLYTHHTMTEYAAIGYSDSPCVRGSRVEPPDRGEFVAELDPFESRQTRLGVAGFKRCGAPQFGHIVIAPADRADAEVYGHGLCCGLLGSPSAYFRRRKIATARRCFYLIVQDHEPRRHAARA